MYEKILIICPIHMLPFIIVEMELPTTIIINFMTTEDFKIRKVDIYKIVSMQLGIQNTLLTFPLSIQDPK